ncbi:carbohydrate sulfotransferase 1-like [Elysia marginata]|uniref:Carbohydrate sulfotransferase 1-like n=1 Tax=Elysia marginata TaxID=1093978 RepID=A0AAV4IJD8_9GAST|nr:carbohydrate sulfotransferase 1-like [Elysia marginata]
MWEVEKLLLEDPDLRVIHLVRDPRGVYVSRRAVRYYFADAPFCARLNEDAKKSAELQTKYPGRILTTRYEDLATNAPKIARILFDFGGIPCTAAHHQRCSTPPVVFPNAICLISLTASSPYTYMAISMVNAESRFVTEYDTSPLDAIPRGMFLGP